MPLISVFLNKAFQNTLLIRKNKSMNTSSIINDFFNNGKIKHVFIGVYKHINVNILPLSERIQYIHWTDCLWRWEGIKDRCLGVHLKHVFYGLECGLNARIHTYLTYAVLQFSYFPSTNRRALSSVLVPLSITLRYALFPENMLI